MVVKIQKIVLSISDYHNATSTHDKANLLICVPNVVYYCKWFSIYVLMSPFCGSGTAKYRPQMVLLIILYSFQYASRKKLLFRYQVFPTALDYSFTITIARCPANFINLSAIIGDLWLSEYRSKLRHDSQIAISGGTLDIFKIPSKKEY